MSNKKGHGIKYNLQEVLKDFEDSIVKYNLYKKQAYYRLAIKYNKSAAHIRRIVRDAKTVK